MNNPLGIQDLRNDRPAGSDLFPSLGVSYFILPSVIGFPEFHASPAFMSPGGSEFLFVMLVLILLFGAKDAPRIFRTLHNTLDKIQRAAASFRYKIMYGDLHQGTTDEEPYDVEADYPEDEDDPDWEQDEVEDITEVEEDDPAHYEAEAKTALPERDAVQADVEDARDDPGDAKTTSQNSERSS